MDFANQPPPPPQQAHRGNHTVISLPSEVFLDVFSFYSGIDLSRIRRVHPFFRQLIGKYTNSLADTTVQHLIITMDRKKYLGRIELVKDAHSTLTFADHKQFLPFMREHPMRIKLLTMWNTIWIPKLLVDLNNIVQIDEVQIRQNQESRYFVYTAHGKLIYIGNVLHQCHKLSAQMEDHIRYYNTSRKMYPRRGLNVSLYSMHLTPPSNFQCSAIRVQSTDQDVFSGYEIVDWICAKNCNAFNNTADGFGRVLIFEHTKFELPLSEMVQQIFQQISKHPRTVDPFTLLFQDISGWAITADYADEIGGHQHKCFEPIRCQMPNTTMRFLATPLPLLHENGGNEKLEQMPQHHQPTTTSSSFSTLGKFSTRGGKQNDYLKKRMHGGGTEEVEIPKEGGILPARFAGQQFAFIIQYKHV